MTKLFPLLWVMLVPAEADAGCGGLRGKTLEECQQADSQMRANYFEQMEQAQKTTLHYTFNKQPFTITAAQLSGDFLNDICDAKKKPGEVVQLDAVTRKAIETTTCATVKRHKPRVAEVLRHGPYSTRYAVGNYWCGFKVGPWTWRDANGAVTKTEILTINDSQADCEAPRLSLELVKLEPNRWTLR